jgi:CheY-like chemotaxis protein
VTLRRGRRRPGAASRVSRSPEPGRGVECAALSRPTHVLIVEDDATQRDLLAEVLRGEGYAVSVASDGAEGLAAARAAAPDVVLLDLMMPGMDGASFLAELRRDEALASARIVLATGVHTTHVTRLLRPDATLFKPYGLRDLLSTIARLAAGGAGPA